MAIGSLRGGATHQIRGVVAADDDARLRQSNGSKGDRAAMAPVIRIGPLPSVAPHS